MRSLHFLLVALGVSLLLAASASAQGRDAESDRRARWRTLGAERQAELLQRYEKLQSLDAEEREALVERGRRLGREIEATLRTLDPEERAQIDGLSGEERARVLRGLVADRARAAAARLRDRMTPDQLQRLEGAAPKERITLLREVRERELSDVRSELQRIGQELRIPRRQMRRLESATPEERRAGLVELVREHIGDVVDRHGLPEGVSGRRWRSMQKMDDEAFVHSFLRVRGRHPQFGMSPERWESRLRRGGALAERLDSFGAPTPEARRASPKARESQLRRRALKSNRARVMEMMARRTDLDAELSARIEALSEDQFFRMHRSVVSGLRRGKDPRTLIERWLERAER